MLGPWQDEVEKILQGVRRGGDRSNQRQEELRRQGATRVPGGKSAHNEPDHAIDIRTPFSLEEAERRLRDAGMTDIDVLVSNGGSLHIERGRFSEEAKRRNRNVVQASSNRGRITQDDDFVASIMGEVQRGPSGEGGRSQEIANPFTAGAEMRERSDRLDESATRGVEVVDQAVETISNLQDSRIEAAKEKVERTSAINEELQTRTQAQLEHMRPLFEARRKIADRQAELARMNPIERGFRSLFDASYDREHLRGLDAATGQQLEAAAAEYGEILRLQSTMMDLIDRNANAEDSIAVLGIQGAEQDMQLAGQSFAALERSFGVLTQRVGAQVQLTAAQQQMRSDVISRMTAGEARSYMSQAEKNGGTVVIDGAELSAAELGQVVRTYEAQDLEMQRLRLSRETAQRQNDMAAIELEEFHRDRVIGTMNTAQLQQAIANGGVYRGEKFDMRRLGDALRQAQERDSAMVGQANLGTGRVTQQVIQSLGVQSRQLTQNSMSLFGHVPQELQAQQQRIATRIEELAAITNQAAKSGPGVAAQQMARMTEELIQMQSQYQETAKRMAQRWAGNHRELMPLAEAFLSNSNLSAPAAIDGLITLVRTGQGQNLQGPARAAYEAARLAIKGIEEQSGGTSFQELMDRASTPQGKAQLQNRLREAVGAAVQGAYGGQISNQVLSNAPAIGRQLGHEAGAIDVRAWQSAILAGDEESYEVIGSQLNIKPSEARTLFTSGPTSPTWQRLSGETGTVEVNGQRMDYNQLSQVVNQMQQVNTFRALDATHSNVGGRRPSEVMVSLLRDSNFQNRVSTMSAVVGQSSFGNFVMNSITGTSVGANLYNYAETAQMGQRTQAVQSTRQAMLQAREYAANPHTRMQVILSAMIENPQDVQALMQALKTAHPDQGESQVWRFGSSTQAMEGMAASGEGTFHSMVNTIRSAKFDDPNLERIRRQAAQNWDQAAAMTDRSINALAGNR